MRLFYQVGLAALAGLAGLALASVPAAGNAADRVDKPEPLILSDTVNAPPKDVWRAFTTKEGQESWQVSHAEIDLRIGGLMRTNYAKEGRIGDENTINNQILSYDPERMFSIRIVQPPQNFPFKKAAENVWTVVYFEPVDSQRTKVTVSMLGWEDTDESRKMREFFTTGNKWVLDKLKEHFQKGR